MSVNSPRNLVVNPEQGACERCLSRVEQETIRELIEISFEGRVGLFILILLVTMLIVSIGVTAERVLTYRTARRQSRAFETHVRMSMRGTDMDEAISLGLRHNGPRASVIVSGLMAFKHARLVMARVNAIEEARRASEVSASVVRGKMKRGLQWLASTVSTAALLGCLATMWGILFGFKGWVGPKEALRATLANQYAHALLPTAVGSLISVWTMWSYRYLRSQMEVFEMELESAVLEVVNYLRLTSMKPADHTGETPRTP